MSWLASAAAKFNRIRPARRRRACSAYVGLTVGDVFATGSNSARGIPPYAGGTSAEGVKMFAWFSLLLSLCGWSVDRSGPACDRAELDAPSRNGSTARLRERRESPLHRCSGHLVTLGADVLRSVLHGLIGWQTAWKRWWLGATSASDGSQDAHELSWQRRRYSLAVVRLPAEWIKRNRGRRRR